MPKPAPKRPYKIVKPIKQGFEIADPSTKGWILGESIGQGGFGCLYAASSKDNPKVKIYVLKIEPQENGPLFTESHFYARCCKENMLNEWKSQHNLSFLGIPRYISKGLFEAPDGVPCRFLVMDRFSSSLEDCLNFRKFLPSDIPNIAIQTIDALEYIHSKDYVHADIKASNLLRMDDYQFYLADFGLVTLFRIDGKHKIEKANPKLRDNGTLEFCSRDAHAGLSPSRRGDMEILLFNLIHWLYRTQPTADQGPCAGLPWNSIIGDPKVRANVSKAARDRLVATKNEAMEPSEAPSLVNSVGLGRLPALESLIRSIGALKYDETPDYSKYKDLLKSLQKSLATMESKRSTVLAEVNDGDTPSFRDRKGIDNVDATVKKLTDKEAPKSASSTKKPKKQVNKEKQGSGREEVRRTTKQATETPVRRSERTRRPLASYIFDSSSDEVEEDDKHVSEIKPSLHKKKRTGTPSHYREQNVQRPVTASVVRGIATQTSPNLLKQLEREERRRNFF